MFAWIKELRRELQLDKKYGYDPAERAYKTKQELPPGDPIREAAQKRCAQEYAASNIQEDAYTWKYGYKSFGKLEDATTFAKELCMAVKVKPIKEVRLCELGYEHAGAYYKAGTKCIYVRLPVSVTFIVHETAHHMEYMEHFFLSIDRHGKRFLDNERRLFDYLREKQ